LHLNSVRSIETPFGEADRVLGGSAPFIGLAASFFNVNPCIVSSY